MIVSESGEPAQTAKTLRTLAVPYQRNVAVGDYEVVVVQDPSRDHLAAEEIARFGRNFRHLTHEPVPGRPFGHIEAAYRSCDAPIIGFFGHVAVFTPRLVEHALAGARFTVAPLMVVPVYDPLVIGSENPLDRVDFDADGYEILASATFGPENSNGYLTGLLESEAFFCARDMSERILSRSVGSTLSGMDKLYAYLLTIPKARLIALGSEGCVRQEPKHRDIARGAWLRPEREPLLYGALPGQGRDFFAQSIGAAAWHSALCRQENRPEWLMDSRSLRAPVGPSASVAPASAKTPLISIVVVVYRMARQAENTLHSLSAAHQWNVRESDYEIVVVENRSPDMLGRERACRTGGNVRYFEREERGVSPVPAFNFGVSQARGNLLGLMIDGARMVTPRVLENVLMARHVCDRPLIVVPGYHLGPERQFLSSKRGYDEAVEQRLLESIDWRNDGHRLFEIASFDDTTLQGFMNPLLESTCLFCPRECLDEVGGTDERFDLPGGGIVNLDLFERLCRLERTKLVVLWAEGAFHQYHGGTSSKSIEDREALLELFRRQYQEIRGRPYGTWDREPHLFGAYVGPAYALHVESAAQGKIRFDMIRDWGRVEWPYE